MASGHFRVLHSFFQGNLKAGKLPTAGEVVFLLERVAIVAELDQDIFPWANLQSLRTVGHIAETLVMVGLFADALPYCRRAVRLQCILHGRDHRDKLYDEWLAQALSAKQDGQTPLTLEMCAFCEESPDRAALKLNRCGKCRQIAYCSKGCQTAHWPGHKAQCKKS
jgi:hypothetical protein